MKLLKFVDYFAKIDIIFVFAVLLLFGNQVQAEAKQVKQQKEAIVAKQNVDFNDDISKLYQAKYTYNLTVNKYDDQKSIDNVKTVSNSGLKFEFDKNSKFWMKNAPITNILKRIDFSQVDGKAERYYLNGGDYQLSLIPHQGAWGRVYVLERIQKNASSEDSVPEKLCVVKVLWNRTKNPLSKEEYRKRHIREINNTVAIANSDITIKLYGIVKNNDDNYLLFLEQGDSSRERFKEQPMNTTLQQILDFIKQVDMFHQQGYTHGDLTLNNMLFSRDTIKLCDWYSLTQYKNVKVVDYKYDGDNLPPEAILAFYYKSDKDKLKYVKVLENQKTYIRYLHPVFADRFCLAISLLEILEPDLYDKFEKVFPKGFNPYAPKSLEFYEPYCTLIRSVQTEVHRRSKHAGMNEELTKQKILEQLAVWIDVEPGNRIMLLEKN